MLLPLLLAGCIGNVAKSSIEPGQLDVFGVSMNSPTDYVEIMGVKGTDEPCLRGKDRTFYSLDISIGYGRDGKIRKITTRNPQNSMFGVHPGDPLASALVKTREAGFVENDSPYRFRKNELTMKLLVDGNGELFGLILEAVDPTSK